MKRIFELCPGKLNTIQRAQTSVVAGDTVYIRGGNYTMTESQIAKYTGIWAYVTIGYPFKGAAPDLGCFE
ncbi:hypothetical protein GO495_30845 [Chitinophaga oryziterrae]|uniref:Uncharacterized protein n=1 Tax=Chitinophaga oryziterrae TaxID=1031224 RepID=A0A6N8JKX6_9BACT|nr:hypothetical protein [Chitinophaga oryziterrae]MVT45026.1 hypothetical protein [Chitinophaga oryziterrae]